MKIILYDGRIIKAKTIEISTDGKNIIVDGIDVIPCIEILRIKEA